MKDYRGVGIVERKPLAMLTLKVSKVSLPILLAVMALECLAWSCCGRGLYTGNHAVRGRGAGGGDSVSNGRPR